MSEVFEIGFEVNPTFGLTVFKIRRKTPKSSTFEQMQVIAVR